MAARYFDRPIQAFVVKSSPIEKLVRLLEKHIGEVEISAKCVDKIERPFSTVQDLIDYENPKEKRICQLNLRSRSDDFSKSANITFDDNDSSSWTTPIKIEGLEEEVCLFKEKVLDIVKGMRPGYHRLATVDLWKVFLIFYFLIFVLAMLVLSNWICSLDSPPSDSEKIIANASWLLSMGGSALIAGGLYLLRNISFPKGDFAIGQGENRYENRKKIRSVIISFLVSLAAGVVLLLLGILI